MIDCQNAGGYPYECKVPCQQYKTRPWYISCPAHMTYTPSVPTTPYGLSPIAPTAGFPWQNDPCYSACKKMGGDSLHCCFKCGFC